MWFLGRHKRAAPKRYFTILGISSNATANEIRSAYRRLAKEFHPDHYAGGSETFREIQEAYSVLGNTLRRCEYEQKISKVALKRPLRRTRYPEPEPLIPEERPIDMGGISPVRSFQSFTPSFDEIFDWLWKNFSDLDQPESDRVQNLTHEVTLTPEQAHLGGSARVMANTGRLSNMSRLRWSGAFQGFNNNIYEYGIEKDWFSYRLEVFRQIAIDWCEENDISYVED